MRYICTALILLWVATASVADRPVRSVVKHFKNMRVVYVTDQNGKRVPLITNLDEKGKPMGPKVGPTPDWTRAYRARAATLGSATIAPVTPGKNETMVPSVQGIRIPPN